MSKASSTALRAPAEAPGTMVARPGIPFREPKGCVRWEHWDQGSGRAVAQGQTFSALSLHLSSRKPPALSPTGLSLMALFLV